LLSSAVCAQSSCFHQNLHLAYRPFNSGTTSFWVA